ncbi:MAG: hypothetical protein EOP00_12340 [Pedobacter sp.]|nr:MAG: hypothetical protein EOP00_12340 [Pedobacter sp.]
MIKIITILIGISVVFSMANAQISSGKISGKLIDEKQNSIAFATLSLHLKTDSSLVKGSISNDEGKFIFEQINYGSYFLKIEALGFETKFIDGIVVNAKQLSIDLNDIILKNHTEQLNEVSIIRKKPLIERKSDQTILNINNSILATGNTALEILSRAPGVAISNDGNISLRGKSGVNVMINGKLTYLPSDQILNLLRNTNGNAIETIALIHNPSAKFDAAGGGGIINIKLKKNENYGTNANLILGGGYGSYYKSNGVINFNHRNQKINLFGSYDYSNNKEFENLALKRSNQFGSEITYFDQKGRDIYNRISNSYKIGLDYEINPKNTIGFMLNGYANKAKNTTLNSTSFGSSPSIIDSSIVMNNIGNYNYDNQSYNLNYKSVIDTNGQELNIDLDYATFENTSNSVYENDFYDTKGSIFKSSFIFRNAAPSTIRIWSGKVDYNYSFKEKTKLETGIKSALVTSKNNFIQENLINNNWTNDDNFSNNFDYTEAINAAYANVSHKFNGLDLQFGLRTELTISEGVSPSTRNIVKRKYLDFFPSVSLTKTVNDNHEFGLSYNKRIGRPDYQSLNPFVYFADLYTFAQGNPYLNPQYTNSFALSYNYQQKWTASLGYSYTKDVITTTLINDLEKKTLFILEQNLASEQNYNLNVGAPITITKWWETNNDFTLYYNQFKSPNLMGMPFNSGKLSYIINSSHTFNISPSINAELAMDYHSAQVYGTYAVKPLYGIDFGISKSFAAKRANVKFAINDVFNMRKANIKSAILLQDYQLSQKQESRIFRLSFSYNFGSSSIKAARERSKSSDTEQSRVKSGN